MRIKERINPYHDCRTANPPIMESHPAVQRQWVSLLPEEIAEVLSVHYMYMSELVHAIDSKLREKNGGQA